MTAPAAPRAVGAPARFFLAAVLALGVAFGFATTASATTAPAAQNAVGASTVTLAPLVGSVGDVSPATHLESYDSQAQTASATGVAVETGGAASVRLGQAGEAAVRGAYDIGPKATAEIGGRTRIFDGLNSEAVSEVKNVANQAFTQQLKDSLAYAQMNTLRFDLYVRPDTYLTDPLFRAGLDPFNPLSIRYIP